MDTVRKEITLFVFSVVVGGVVPLVIFGADFYFKTDQAVQLYDTYFIFQSYIFPIATIGLTLFLTFLFRAFWTRFRSWLALIFLVFGALLLGMVVGEVQEILNR
jgi:hypothetical protein